MAAADVQHFAVEAAGVETLIFENVFFGAAEAIGKGLVIERFGGRSLGGLR